jgi:hypothetical protein
MILKDLLGWYDHWKACLLEKFHLLDHVIRGWPKSDRAQVWELFSKIIFQQESKHCYLKNMF